MKAALNDANLQCVSIIPDLFADKIFANGSYSSRDAAVRKHALEYSRKMCDIARKLDCNLLNIWPGQDGFDYLLSTDYDSYRSHFVEAIATLNAAASHAVSTPVQEPTLKKGVGALTRREIEVLCLVAEDKTDRAIADILFISTRTVSDHMSRIIRKLGVYSRTGAVVRALIEQWCQ